MLGAGFLIPKIMKEIISKIVKKVEEKTGEKIASVSILKCSHDKIRMTKSGIWKCKCGYTHF